MAKFEIGDVVKHRKIKGVIRSIIWDDDTDTIWYRVEIKPYVYQTISSANITGVTEEEKEEFLKVMNTHSRIRNFWTTMTKT